MNLLKALLPALLLALLLAMAPVCAQDAEAPVDPAVVADDANDGEAAAGTETVTTPADDQVPEEVDAGESADDDPVARAAAAAAESREPPMVAVPERTLALVPHPVYTPEQAELVFAPLVAYLNAVTPYEIHLQPVRDFHKYWLDIRRGEAPDLTMDDAHITAWRITRQGYQPMVRQVESARFSLLTSPEYADDDLRQFVGRRITTLPAPSLGYVMLTQWFSNPLQQPRILSTAQSWRDGVEIVFSMEADAAVAPDPLPERYPNLHPVITSEPMPGLTISAAPTVDPLIRDTLREALLTLHENEAHFTALNELDTERFIRADTIEYEGLDQLLESVFSF